MSMSCALLRARERCGGQADEVDRGRVLTSSADDLPGYGSSIVEVVISDSDPLVGFKLGDVIYQFAEKYNLGVITLRRKDWHLSLNEGKDDELLVNDVASVNDHTMSSRAAIRC